MLSFTLAVSLFLFAVTGEIGGASSPLKHVAGTEMDCGQDRAETDPPAARSGEGVQWLNTPDERTSLQMLSSSQCTEKVH